MAAGIILVHGYTGSPHDLAPLAAGLADADGSLEVTSVRLPGHGAGTGPAFAEKDFVAEISAAAAAFSAAGREIVIVGHSTGGILALAAIGEHALVPRLLVLAAVPNRIDGRYLERWNRHSAGSAGIAFASLARMVSFCNAVGSRPQPGRFPVLLLHGSHDGLVPCSEAFAWRGRFAGPVRTVVAQGAGHDVFRGPAAGFVLDAIARAAADAVRVPTEEEAETVERLVDAEPEAARFLSLSPVSAGHLGRSPGARLLGPKPPGLGPEADSEPVFANIEITTRCNARCAFCARTAAGREERDMPPELFGRVLDLLPHAYRITLVGLGEPLLHPGVADLVAEASSRGRRVAVATNALGLDRTMSHRLIDAGLDSVAFSIDATVPDVAAAVRPGIDVATAIENIAEFAAISSRTRPVGKAVFSAVSVATAPYLEQLVETVAGLGVDVLMLSDLNFRENLPHTLWKNADRPLRETVHRAIRKAFALGLPVLSVDGLEGFALAKRYRKHLLIPPARLYHRSLRRTHCLSPWQTIPVAVDGTVTVCDCRPGDIVGDLLARPFADLWNGPVMREHRRRMLGPQPPGPCGICPRL